MVSHAAGRKDHDRAVLLFNQSQVLSLVSGAIFFVVMMAIRLPYARTLGADAATATLAADYLLWFIPAMSLQFAMVAMGSALRGTGNFKPGMVVQTATVILNMLLAPILIFGWFTGRADGRGRRGDLHARRGRGRRRSGSARTSCPKASTSTTAGRTGGRSFRSGGAC